MKVLKILLIAVVLIVVAILAWGAILPSSNHVEREIVINRPTETIYTELSSFEGFNEWSPWFTIDPEGTSYTYEGPGSGVGAKMSWTSEHPDVGNGSQEIIEVVENELIKSRMNFVYSGDYYANFVLTEEGDGTKLVWSYDAENLGLMSRLMAKIFNVDKMVGGSYERGLQTFKEMMENRPVEEPAMDEEAMESDSTMMEADTTVVE